MNICQFPFKKVHTAIILEGSGSSLLFLFEVCVLVRAFMFKVSRKLIIIISLFTLQTFASIAEQIWPTVKVSQSLATTSNLCFCLAYWFFASNYWTTSIHTPQKIKREKLVPQKKTVTYT